MPTPDQFRLKIPFYQPDSVSQHETNLRAIERWANRLPFAYGQHYINVFGPSIVIPPSSSHEFVLYPDTDIPGFAIPEPGSFNTVITIEMDLDPIDEGQEVGFTAIRDIVLYGSSGQSERYVTASGATKRLVTVQGFYNLNDDRLWSPTISVDNGSGVPSVVVESISAMHQYYPPGLYGQFNKLARD